MLYTISNYMLSVYYVLYAIYYINSITIYDISVYHIYYRCIIISSSHCHLYIIIKFQLYSFVPLCP